MKKEKQQKTQMFLVDEPICNIDDDEFQLHHIAEIISKRIKQNIRNKEQNTLHIGLFGKWGSGKSTVIKLLERKLEKNYRIIYLSVWKYASNTDSLHRQLINDFSNELGIEETINPDVRKEVTDILTKSGVLSNNFKEIFSIKMLLRVLGLSIILPIAVLLLDLIQSAFTCKPLTYMLLLVLNYFMIIFITILMSLIKNSSISNTISNTIEYLPFKYKYHFNKSFEKINAECKEKKIKVIVFEDLDRLNYTLMKSILTDIKTYFNYSKCIYIVPFDDSQLKKAIEEEFKNNNNNISERCHKYLNKIFNFIIRLPILEKANMKEYAKKISEDLIWKKEIGNSYTNVISILIWHSIDTPRKVKEILNNFTSDWELAKQRDPNKNNIAKVPESIAIFTVLKTLFPDDYNKIEKNIKYIKDNNYSQLHDDCKNFLQLVDMPKHPEYYIYFVSEKLNPETQLQQFSNYYDEDFDFLSEYNKLDENEKKILSTFLLKEYENGHSKLHQRIIKIVFSLTEIFDFSNDPMVWKKNCINNADFIIQNIKIESWFKQVKSLNSYLTYNLLNFVFTSLSVFIIETHNKTSDDLDIRAEADKKLYDLMNFWKNDSEEINCIDLTKIIDYIETNIEVGLKLLNYFIDNPKGHSIIKIIKWDKIIEEIINKDLIFEINYSLSTLITNIENKKTRTIKISEINNYMDSILTYMEKYKEQLNEEEEKKDE